MRILIAAHGFPPTHSGGAERRAERMANWFSKNQHEVEVFAVEDVSQPGFQVKTTIQNDYPVHRVYYDVNDSPDPFRNLYDNPQIGAAFSEFLAGKQFDLVHIVSGYLLGGQIIHAAKARALPVVITLTEYWFMCTRLNLIQPTGTVCSGPESDLKCARCVMEEKRRYRLPARLMPGVMDAAWSVLQRAPEVQQTADRITIRRTVLHDALNATDMVICPSQFLISKFGEFGFDTRNYVFLRQGLATPKANKPAPKAPDENSLRLGYIGQIAFHKGVDLLVDAVIKLLGEGHQISLDLWGSESQEPEYTSQLKARSAPYPTIRWNGSYTGAKVWDVLSALDMLVVPSRWYENSPNVILEAYEMGLPVIATGLGGMAELVQRDKSGLLFDLNSADSLAAQIQRVKTDNGLLPRLKAGIPTVKTIEEEMQETLLLYEQLIERRLNSEQL